MPKKTFGSRREPPGHNSTSGVDKLSKVDFVRGVIASTIQQYQSAGDGEKSALAMQIRILQDQLASLKRLTAVKDHRSKELEWVDIWRPD